MPNSPKTLIENLSKKADRITDAIERKQAAVDRALYVAERDLFALVVEQFLSRLSIRDGIVENTPGNLALLQQLDNVFDQFQREILGGVMPVFVDGLLEVVAMTGELYTGMEAATVLDAIARDNAVIRAAVGVDNAGNVLRGTVLWDVSNASPVRDGLKNVILKGIQSGATLRDFTAQIKDYVTGTPGTAGRLRTHYRTYAYDLFNQVQEAKNEQFRRGLDLQWFLYVGDLIRDSRVFCQKRAGKVFAVIEADTEWPNDRDLVGKSSGIPYNPRIDRGRWNCRHRIRYITEEMADQIDAAKVKRIKQKYGGSTSD